MLTPFTNLASGCEMFLGTYTTGSSRVLDRYNLYTSYIDHPTVTTQEKPMKQELRIPLVKSKTDPEKVTITICRDVLEIMGIDTSTGAVLLKPNGIAASLIITSAPAEHKDCKCK